MFQTFLTLFLVANLPREPLSSFEGRIAHIELGAAGVEGALLLQPSRRAADDLAIQFGSRVCAGRTVSDRVLVQLFRAMHSRATVTVVTSRVGEADCLAAAVFSPGPQASR